MPFDRRRNDPWQTYRPAPARKVEEGIATSKQRGAMAASWWSKRFVEVLDGYGLGSRMQRGRRYARSGQVVHLEVSAGLVAAQVQGSRARPYLVTVARPEATAAQWTRIDEAMRERVGLVARLLAGEVPEDLEAAFADAGTALLPAAWKDLRASCSCPDSENPCKHIAAVLYVLADQLDGDPWLLLAWRGRSRDQVLELFASGATAAAPPAPWWPFAPGTLVGRSGTGAPEADPPVEAAGVLRRLDPLAATIGDVWVLDLLRPAYEAVCPDRPEPDIRGHVGR